MGLTSLHLLLTVLLSVNRTNTEFDSCIFRCSDGPKGRERGQTTQTSSSTTSSSCQKQNIHISLACKIHSSLMQEKLVYFLDGEIIITVVKKKTNLRGGGRESICIWH